MEKGIRINEAPVAVVETGIEGVYAAAALAVHGLEARLSVLKPGELTTADLPASMRPALAGAGDGVSVEYSFNTNLGVDTGTEGTASFQSITPEDAVTAGYMFNSSIQG